MDRQRFESGDKFWEIWAADGQVYTHFGKLGGSGQTKLKATSDPDSEIAAMIAKKAKEGFAPATAAKAATPVVKKAKKSGSALDQHLAEVTDDPKSALVLADWLQEQGNPWGEVIALQVGGKNSAADKLLKKKGKEILPALADKATVVTWKNGFVETVQFNSDATSAAVIAAAKAFLASPIAARIDWIRFSPVREKFKTWIDWGQSTDQVVAPYDLAKLAKLVPAHVTKLGFGGWLPAAAAAYTQFPDLKDIAKQFPQLTELELVGTASSKLASTTKLANLTALTIRFAQAETSQLEAIADSKWTELTSLEVGLGGNVHTILDELYPAERRSQYPKSFAGSDFERLGRGREKADTDVRREDLERLLGGAYPKLTHFGLESSVLNTELLRPLWTSKLLKQVKTLNLASTQLGDEDAPAIIKQAKKLEHLEAIDLRRNGFHPKTVKQLQKALPQANLEGPAVGDEEVVRPEFYFRYCAVME
ncbi:MAG: hypothetical protein QM831_31725 [Kofleriaceae bacterium]